MDEAGFWRIVEETRQDSGGDIRLQSVLLTDVLGELDPDEVLDFRRHLVAAHRRAYSHRMLQAADLLVRGVGDDQYTNLRSWLVCQGEEVFEAAVADPDAIAELSLGGRTEDDIAAAASFTAVPDEVYSELTDEEIPLDEEMVEMLGELAGEPIDSHDEAALSATFPRLWARRAA